MRKPWVGKVCWRLAFPSVVGLGNPKWRFVQVSGPQSPGVAPPPLLSISYRRLGVFF